MGALDKHARRRRRLKQRQAAQQRKDDRHSADYLFEDALAAFHAGRAPEALRLAKKALALAPQHAPALEVAGRIYFQAGQYPDAAHYFGLWRKIQAHPVAIYNCGLAHMKMGRHSEAAADLREFLAVARGLSEPRWATLIEEARHWLKQLADGEKPIPQPPRQTALFDPAPAKPEAAAAAAPELPPRASPPRVTVEFLPAPVPDFRDQPAAPLADYLLRRRFLELRLAQSFEDLICLGSLTGVDSYVYQQETVRKVLRHFKGRALLADEVGLGKTIEACLALKEYWMRGMVRRALALAPPSLVAQWKGELTEKFGFSPASPDGPAFRRDPARFWREQPLIVASMAMARLEPHAGILAAIPWDLVIVDEAHCLKNRSSANWKLVNALQKKFILMLTATPVENNLIELYNLITLLKPGLLSTEGEFRKLFVGPSRPTAPRNPERLRSLLGEVMVRNTRAAADVRLPPRVAASVVVSPSPREAQLYEMVSSFVRQRFPSERAGGAGGRLALEWLQRQAGSSPQALCRSTSRALGQVDGGADSWLAGGDRGELEAIQELSAQIGDSSKAARLGQMLAARSGKIVVFTEFTATLDYLVRIAEQHSVPCARFAGDMTRAEKDAAMARFRDEAEVLLSTGTGGEGRNLQFANTVINFDLPWNPMRLEQRVGRVHRIGQTREVFVFNFCQGGTIEEQLLRILHEKINMFELVIGEIDAIVGSLQEGDFSQLVLELWMSAGHTDRRQEAFDGLAERLIAAKNNYARTKELDEALFRRDFEA